MRLVSFPDPFFDMKRGLGTRLASASSLLPVQTDLPIFVEGHGKMAARSCIRVRPPAGLFVVDKEKAIPLKDVSVKAQLNGYLVGLESTLKYSNEETGPLEVVFKFPIEESFAVVGLEAVIAGRKIKAEIREKEEAHQMYDDALASGFSAALAEEKSADIFSISLGNLPPKTDAELHLKFVGELPLDPSGAVQFTLPSVLKPRYTPAGSTDPLAKVEGEAGQVQHASAPSVFNFSLEIANPEGIADITSPTHSIKSETKDRVQLVTLSDGKPLDKDLVILVQHKAPHEPTATVEKGDGKFDSTTVMGSPAVMLSFFPKFESPKAACEFIFLVDRSGSMRGSYINSARETLILFLKSLPPGCSFNIMGFGSRYESLFHSKSVPYNQENLDKAVKHAETMQADLGGTELLPPLKHIYEQPLLPGLPRQVFVLTDGSVSNTYSCIEEVKKNVQHARVFTFGIGSGASTALVNGLARAGNGTAQFVREGERMQPKVISSLKQALQPSVTNLQIQFDVPDGYEMLQAPAKPPVIFNGEKTVAFGILKCKAPQQSPTSATCTATLKGQIFDKAISFSVPFQLPGEDHPFSILTVHHLAAKNLIKDWESGYGMEGLSDSAKKGAIVKLSVESSVVSAHTAYIAIDEDQSKPIEGAIKTWDITTQMAAQEHSHHFGHVRYCMAAPAAVRKASPKGKMKKRSKGIAVVQSFSSASASPPMMAMASSLSSRSAPPSRFQASAAPSGPLTTLISLQQADGSWNFNTALAQVLSKSLAELKSACPVKCEGGVCAVWATVLSLVFLETKCGSQRDEWELVAMKAELWLADQPLPASVDLSGLRAAAQKCL